MWEMETLSLYLSSVKCGAAFQNSGIGITQGLQTVLGKISPFSFGAYKEEGFLFGVSRKFTG